MINKYPEDIKKHGENKINLINLYLNKIVSNCQINHEDQWKWKIGFIYSKYILKSMRKRKQHENELHGDALNNKDKIICLIKFKLPSQ